MVYLLLSRENQIKNILKFLKEKYNLNNEVTQFNLVSVN